MTYELIAIFDARKDFYKKATVRIVDNMQQLYSYNTHVLTETAGKITWMTDTVEHYTLTTCRHINEFLRQRFGWTAKTKKQLLKMAEDVNK